jgi:sulfur-oxidizing protein SoxY
MIFAIAGRMPRRGWFFAVLAATFFLSDVTLAAQSRNQAPWERLEAAMERLDGATPRLGGIRLDLPGVTQDGSAVPLTVEVDSPMTAEDYIEAVYLFAADNPSLELADVYFSPLAGQANFSTRVRLNRSQTVLALARTSNGNWLAAHRDVRVTVSGCLSRADSNGLDTMMRTRVRVPDRLRNGAAGNVLTLIDHPMETGLREDRQGQTVPERIIEEFRAEFNGEPVVKVRLYRAISANPYLRFFIAPPSSGEGVLYWREDTGETVTETFRIEVG